MTQKAAFKSTNSGVPRSIEASDSILSFYIYGNNPKLKERFEKIPNFLPELELRGYESLVPEGETPLWLHWREYAFDYLHEGKSEQTIEAVLNALRFLVRHCEIYSIEECNKPRILKLKLQEAGFKRNWRGTSSYNTYRKNIGIYFKWLEDIEVIEISKIYKVRKLKESTKSRPHLSEEQIVKLRKHLKARECEELQYWRNRLLFELAINTSARIGELLNLTMEDIFVKDGKYIIYIQGIKQHNDIRPFYFPNTTKEIFEHYLHVRAKFDRRDEPHVFLSRKKGRAYKYNSGVARLCPQLSKELGFHVTMHMFRRSGATILAKNGHSLSEIMHQLGHTKVSTCKSYIQADVGLTKKNVKTMDSIR